MLTSNFPSVLVILLLSKLSQGEVITTTVCKQGQLRGSTVTSALGRKFLAFKGVPYAAPPLGPLRFKDPQPPNSWQGVRDALDDPSPALQQPNMHKLEILGNEDCLYLNIYTGALTGKKPVYVWIHGGRYYKGSGDSVNFGPDFLIERDIVIVSVNHRLGALGFFNLDHKDASGNQGLKDQVAALRWIRDNISAFGGDENNVTLGGHSVGSFSAHLLSLSPLTKGLFKRIIMHSGTAMRTSRWFENINKEFSYKLARKFSNDTHDPEEIISQLQAVPANDFIKEQFSVVSDDDKSMFVYAYGPCIDTASEEPLLPAPAIELLPNSYDVPTMIGFTSHEFLIFYPKHNEESVKNFNRLLARWLSNYTRVNDTVKFPEIEREVRDFYFHGKSEATIDDVESIVEFISDVAFTNSAKETVESRKQQRGAITYFYEFKYHGNQATYTSNSMKPPPVMRGVAHGDELPYVFYMRSINKNPPPEVGSRDRIAIERMTRLITNFIIFGDPTVRLDEFITTKWEPVNNDTMNILEIGDELVPSVIDEKSRKYEMWSRVRQLNVRRS